LFPGIVLKMRQALTFSATIGRDDPSHENTGSHFDSCAAHHLGGRGVRHDSDQQPAVGAQDQLNGRLEYAWGVTMLSVDQFLRLITVPAVVVAFLIASQISGAGIFHPASAQVSSLF
jgi:hypothetical protein